MNKEILLSDRPKHYKIASQELDIIRIETRYGSVLIKTYCGSYDRIEVLDRNDSILTVGYLDSGLTYDEEEELK